MKRKRWFLLAVFWMTVMGVANPPFGLDSRAPIGPYLNTVFPAVEPEVGDWKVIKAFPQLSFSNPVGLVPEPRSQRLYVHTREGQIYFFDNDPQTTRKTLFLDISSHTQGWNDCGLLGMAFHPQYGEAGSTNRGYFYVFYQYSSSPTSGPDRPPPTTPTYNRLSRFMVPDGSSIADPSSELVLIDQFDQNLWHNGGGMFFHPDDGFLYLSLGDEGGINAEYGNTQRINKGLFSGVIRIDVNMDPAKSHPLRRQPQSGSPQFFSQTAHYFIPNDNPFLDSNGGVLEEFWCLGLRSPHRMTYDPTTKSIWVGDVGGEQREEIDIIEKAGNYQWGYREGNVAGPLPKPVDLLGVEKYPLYEYAHRRGTQTYDGDNCVIGGYVYRGSEHAAKLGGKYLFGDNGSGRIWSLTLNSAAPPTVVELANMPPGFGDTQLSSFGVDHAGEIYMCQMGTNGQVFKLARTGLSGLAAPPAVVSQTGTFSDLKSLAAARGLIPYAVNSPLWSDGAEKSRWMALPNDGPPYSAAERVTFAPAAEWLFPEGTVFVKHFELKIDDNDPNARKRLETRFLVRNKEGTVYGLTYKWRPDHTDADLLPGALSEVISIKTTVSVAPFSSSQDIGGPLPGTTAMDSDAGRYVIQGSGADIWGNADQFRFVYQQRSGDFDVKVRVESLSPESLYTKAGLMARESLTPSSRHVFALVFSDNQPRFNNEGGYELDYRDHSGGPSAAIDPPSPQPRVEFPHGWLRLKRTGDEFTAYAGADGVSWIQYASLTLALPGMVYFGMALTANNPNKLATARFVDFANNRGQTWYYPSRKDCVTCHTPAAHHVLGVKTAQLNRPFPYSAGGVDNQLRTWNHLDLFDSALEESELANYKRMVPIEDATATLEERVRSYLAANCSQCHRPNTGVRANFDLRFDTPLPLQNIINGAVNNALQISGARVVAPGSLAKSIMYLRMNGLDEHQMPPLARNTIDLEAVQTLAEWITSLPPSPPTLGLRGDYFASMNLTGLSLTRTDEAINFDWGAGSPHPALAADGFSVRWTGFLEPRFSELYTFIVTSDDGIRMWLDDQIILDNWTSHAPTEDRGTAALMVGRKYLLRVEYFENTGGAQVRFEWQSPSQPRELIPPSQLSLPNSGPLVFKSPSLGFPEFSREGLRLLLTGESIGSYSVLASTNLKEWLTLHTFAKTNGALLFIDPQANNFRNRFYRAVGSP